MTVEGIRNVLIVGSGLMGHGIGQMFAQAGYHVTLNDLNDEQLRRPMTPSGTNLLGLTKHLAAVEYVWFCQTFGRKSEPPPFDENDENADLRVIPEETTADILRESSNVGTIEIARMLGKERFDRYLRAFGYGELTTLGFPGEASGIIRRVSDYNATSMGSMPIGNGIADDKVIYCFVHDLIRSYLGEVPLLGQVETWLPILPVAARTLLSPPSLLFIAPGTALGRHVCSTSTLLLSPTLAWLGWRRRSPACRSLGSLARAGSTAAPPTCSAGLWRSSPGRAWVRSSGPASWLRSA